MPTLARVLAAGAALALGAAGAVLALGAAGAVLALGAAGCSHPDRKPPGVSNMIDPQTVLTGTTRTFAPDGTVAATLPSPRVTLDAQGNPVLEERLAAADVVVLRRRFDPAGRVIEEEHFDPSGKLDHRLAFHHDAQGRRTEEIMSFSDGTVHGRWVDQRDGDGRLLRREFHDRKDAVAVTETYTFTADGLTATAVRGRVGQWTYRYDAAGRIVHKQGGPASGDEMDQESIEYEYDARGRLVRETERDPTGLLRRELRIAYP